MEGKEKISETWHQKILKFFSTSYCKISGIIKKLPRFAQLLILFILLALIIGGLIGGFTRTNSKISGDTIKIGLKNIGELATQAGYFTNVQTIINSREILGVTIPFTQSKYIFSYNGIIKAGFNFSNVNVDKDDEHKKLIITLPEAYILSAQIDENTLKVYDESKNIFTPLKLEKINQSLVALKEEAKKSAIDNGILESARSNAEILIKGFLSSFLDKSQYSIEFR